ncbi:MAG: hypothetical protein ACKVQS_00955 [Fimbriimonadaceae bacterium]
MKRTVMTVMAVFVALGMMSASFGQAAGPRGQAGAGQGQAGGQRGGGQGMRMSPEMQKKMEAIHAKIIKELNLNATQTKAVAAAVKKRDDASKKMRDQMMADRKAGKEGDRTAMQASMKKLRETYMADMKKAMGDANYAKYEKRMKEEMKKLMEEMQKNGGGKGKAGGGKAGGGL